MNAMARPVNRIESVAPAVLEPVTVFRHAESLVRRDHDRERSTDELRSSTGWIDAVPEFSTHGLQLPAASTARTRNR